MKSHSLIPTFAKALTVAILTILVANQTAAAERREEKKLPAASGGTLTLKTFVGTVEVKTHDQEEVAYEAVLKSGGWRGGDAASLDDVVFDYQSSGGDVKITMKWKNDRPPRQSNVNARHTLMIPARYHLDVRTSGGSIIADEIGGQVTARTSGGSIRLGQVNGEIKANTSGGSVEVKEVRGHVEIGTSGGSIQVGNVDGNVLASTSGGGIKLGTVSGEIKGTTSGGSISAVLVRQIEQPLELSTSGGSIQLAVPADFQADLNASTSGGGVACELPVQGTVKRSSIQGKVNGGGPQVTLRTSGGSINVARR